MKIVAIQMDISWNDAGTNVQKAGEMCLRARGSGAELILLPEMFNTGFSMIKGEEAVEAEQIGRTFLQDFAKNEDCFIAGTLPGCEENSSLPFNRLSVFGPSGELGVYDKLHLFGFGGEDKSYRAGSSFLNLQLGELRASFFTCYDLRFPFPFYKLAPDTDLFVVLANWPAARTAHWEALLVARAIESQAYVVGVNRVGSGGELCYDGATQIVSPRGEVLAHGSDEEGLVLGELNLSELKKYRESFPCLLDRREEVYFA